MSNTNNSTPPNFFERYCYRVPFNVQGNHKLIRQLSENGVVVRVDQVFQRACACFDNTIQFNQFRKQIGVV